MNVILRRTRRSDTERIDEIYRQGHNQFFSLPKPTNVVTHAVAETDKIVGFGIVKMYAEALCILDLNESKVIRTEALSKLLSEAFRACEERGIEHLHVYVQDPAMQRILENKFGFKVAVGTALVKEF